MNRRTAISVLAGAGIASIAVSPVASSDDGSDEADVAFELSDYEIVECGTTCRDATAELANDGDDDASDVTVSVTVSADGTDVWESEEDIGTLEAGDTVTREERVDLGYRDAARVRANDGDVDVTTVVESDEEKAEFENEQNVL
ncbi:hypothetical protein RBH26_02635 [Natronolimnohabitans sp. A-GB9]|uniref:hypothetical protein n=1 Tax=Natronolimnohabitans sp. A-GB9 TaxID=3069757 RepID=UPI0027AEC82D|nr:hypothetical protein [Natronolimnohabitans sp. A-GB9]MDQ2049375.1 hypothetical protein [Natronolimnohabitans sp. A-GB9]